MSTVQFENPKVLKFVSLAVLQTGEHICDIVAPDKLTISDLEKGETIAHVTSGSDGMYHVSWRNPDTRYDHWVNAIAGNLAYIQQPKG